jgi:hypothetical protein
MPLTLVRMHDSLSHNHEGLNIARDESLLVCDTSSLDYYVEVKCGKENAITAYPGFNATADSLRVGSLLHITILCFRGADTVPWRRTVAQRRHRGE